MAAPAAFTDQPSLGEDPIHLALRAQVDALVEQRRVHLRRGEINEPGLAQRGQDLFFLGERQCGRVRGAWLGFRRGPDPEPSIVALTAMPIRAPVHTKRGARPFHGHRISVCCHLGVEHHDRVLSALWRLCCCKSADTCWPM